MKRAVLGLMRAGGAFAMMRYLNRRNALIVTYHRFCSSKVDQGTLAKDFDDQLSYLKSHYKVVPLSQLMEHLSSGNDDTGSLPYAAITIDDGYNDAYNIAYPILRKQNVPATLYVVTDFIDSQSWIWTDKMRYLALSARAQTQFVKISGKDITLKLDDTASRLSSASQANSILKTLSDDEKNEQLNSISVLLDINLPKSPAQEYGGVTTEQIKEMDANGLTIGSHTVSHPILTNIDRSRLRFELTDSKSRLEELLKRRVEHFCYPNGNYNDLVVEQTIEAGYMSAVTVDLGLNPRGGNPFKLSRVHTDDSMTHFMQATSGFENLKYQLRSRL